MPLPLAHSPASSGPPRSPRSPGADAAAYAPADHDAAAITGLALLNCLVREVSVPEGQAWRAGPYLIVRLARTGVILRTLVRWPPAGPSWRLGWPVEEQRASGSTAAEPTAGPTAAEPTAGPTAADPTAGPAEAIATDPTGADPTAGPIAAGPTAEAPRRWIPAGWRRLTELVAGELESATGAGNPEFADQVADSHAALAAIVGARTRAAPPADPYIASEQALVGGHRFHPTPKAREGLAHTWLPYAPETHARFQPHWLAVRADAVTGDGDFGAVERLGPRPPEGYRTLPVHPWQLRRLAPRLRAAREHELVVDLGPAGPEMVPTSSVRTLYAPDADLFCKFSLDMRITNCVRKNAWYELAGSVVLSRLLQPIFADLAARFDGCALLAEPAYRSVILADRRCHEGLGVIVREGVRGRVRPGLTPLLAAAIADPDGDPASARRLIHHAAAPAPPAAPPAAPSTPAPAPRRSATPPPSRSAAPPPARSATPPAPRSVPYPAPAAEWLPRAAGPDEHAPDEHALAWWDAYVSRLVPPVLHAFREHGVVLEAHLQNVVMAVDADGMPAQAIFRDLEGAKLVGDRHARTLAALPARVGAALAYDTERGWNRVVYCLFVNHLAEIAATIAASDARLEDRLWRLARHRLLAYTRRYGTDGRLRGLLAGVPLPAKTNLLTRWARAADRRSGSVPVPNPLGGRSSIH